MLTFEKKITYFENSLHECHGNYSDNLKQDIIMFIDEFNSENEKLQLLNKLNSYDEIDAWLQKLISRISLKFDSESELINDFIYDFIELN